MSNFVDDNKIFRTYIDQDADCPVIISIDCGHGGTIKGVYQTAGKQYDHGDFKFFEGIFNRQIGKALAQKFYNNHISYTFTTISNSDESLSQRMDYLAHFVKQNPKYNHVLLSLHGNAAGVESAQGFEFFTTVGLTDSDYAANIYFPHMYDLGLKMRINRAKENEYDKESNFYVIRKAEALGCIAMLFESGFYSNREEALKMMDSEFQGIYVNALYKGTRDLINKIKQDGTVKPV